MRFNNDNLITFMYSMMGKVKKVNNLAVSQDEFTKMMVTIDYINGVDKYESRVGKYDLSKYEIPSQFSDMILPSEVKIADEKKYLNLRSSSYRNKENEKFKNLLSPEDFSIMWASLLSGMRMKTDFKSVTTYRDIRTIDKVDSRITDASHKHIGSTASCVPIFLDTNIFEDRFYNYEVDDSFKEWFKDTLLKTNNN